MDSFLYPLCLMAEDAEASSRAEPQSGPDKSQEQSAPAGPSPMTTAVASRPTEAPTRPNEQDRAMAAGLVMYFAMRGGC
jgi:hypothetical protein